MTDAQLQALADAIRAEAAATPNAEITEFTENPTLTLGEALSSRIDNALALWMNAASSFIVWRTLVTEDEIMQNGFDWVRVDNLSVGRARIWDWLFRNSQRAINPTKANVRAGIAECWKGTAADLAVQAVVLGHCKRAATRAERISVTGTGTTQDPGLLDYQGMVAHNEVSQALNRFPG